MEDLVTDRFFRPGHTSATRIQVAMSQRSITVALVT